MKLDISVPGKGVSKKGVAVSETTFARQFDEGLVHQVVTAYLAGGRQGTRAQKTRSDVRGGGRKPYRQKGTGRARAGTIRSPIWRGGGRTFAARPQNHAQKVNRKMWRAAMRSILSELIRQERVIVVEEFAVEAPKTKQLLSKLKALQLTNVLVVLDDPDENVYLGARNLKDVEIAEVKDINPVNLIGFDKVLFTVDALKKVELAFA